MKIKEKPAERIWEQFQKESALTDEQLVAFQRYAALLIEWNEKYNLTAITDLSGIVQQHFVDSLAAMHYIDFKNLTLIADVGTGAGFPGIPLKIMFPHLKIILIEVTYKKQLFLEEIIRCLELENVEIAGIDWRTFIRTTEAPIELFVTRAALGEEELTRIFRSNSYYRHAQLLYWVSSTWECGEKVKKYLFETYEYQVKHKARKLAVFKSL